MTCDYTICQEKKTIQEGSLLEWPKGEKMKKDRNVFDLLNYSTLTSTCQDKIKEQHH